MKSHLATGLRPIHLYASGDLLLEFDRLTTNGQPAYQILSNSAKPAEPAEWLGDIAKPSPEDFPALTKALQVLKLSPDNVKAYHEMIGTAITIASAVVWVVGAYFTVVSVLNELFGDDEESATDARLAQLTMAVGQIYGYLAGKERRGLHDEAVTWRENLDSVRNAMNNANISRSPLNLDALVRLKDQLDQDLGKMLDPAKADIAFLRGVYGYVPHSSAHYGLSWIDACASPFASLTNGTPLNYRDPATELQGLIWDPCHYIDVLLSGIIDRLLLLAVTEPAYRSTFYDMEQVKNLSDALTVFINRWRSSLIVFNPLAGIDESGLMHHPETTAPPGIALGAIDPVTGVAFYQSFWDDFAYTETWKGSIAAKGKPDETRVKNPGPVRAKALDLQARFYNAAVRASGISRLVELRARLQDILNRPTIGSDFVKLPNAGFSLIQMTGPAPAVEHVELGFVGQYSKNPGKKYEGRRYAQTFEKRFRFAMPMRADVSHVQLGYRIEFGELSLPLIPYSVSSGQDDQPRFPSDPIAMELHAEDWDVYDVYQSVVFTQADENAFEGGVEADTGKPYDFFDPIHRVPKSLHGSYFDFFEPVRLIPAERLFLNMRKGPVAFSVSVRFDAQLNHPEQAYLGHATVTIRNLEPERCTGGVILPVTVFETRVVDKNGTTEEFIADRMTIHLVPTFLVVGPDYFTDRREGMEAIDRIFGGINERYAISALEIIPVGPEWAVKRKAVEEAVKIDAIQQFAREEPEVARHVLAYHRTPMIAPMEGVHDWTIQAETIEPGRAEEPPPLDLPTAT